MDSGREHGQTPLLGAPQSRLETANSRIGFLERRRSSWGVSDYSCKRRSATRIILPLGPRLGSQSLTRIQSYIGATGQLIRISATVIAIPAAGGSMCVSPC